VIIAVHLCIINVTYSVVSSNLVLPNGNTAL
jgi:hypothetical protein